MGFKVDPFAASMEEYKETKLYRERKDKIIDIKINKMPLDRYGYNSNGEYYGDGGRFPYFILSIVERDREAIWAMDVRAPSYVALRAELTRLHPKVRIAPYTRS